LVRKLQRKRFLARPRRRWEINVEMYLKINKSVEELATFKSFRVGSSGGFIEGRKEPSVSILDQLRYHQFLKKGPAQACWLSG
jgi:hypothetical protein